MASGPQRPRRRRRRQLLIGLIVASVLAVGLLIGFISFVNRVLVAEGAEAPEADGIVVLTGGQSRIEEALQLLERGNARRLLISGVNPRTTVDELRRENGHAEDGSIFDCCVDIGRLALDTEGNAAEAAEWARAHGFKSLIVVTSDYHMPRSMVEFSRQMPDEIEIHFHPIVTISVQRIAAEPQIMRVLVMEYGKYLAALARTFVLPPKPLGGQAGSPQ